MSDINYVSVKQKDGFITHLSCFLSPKPPIASILILHGMAEHEKRYHSFAQFLSSQGYDVYLYNHRGHGSETKINDLGFIHPEHGDQLLVTDAIEISEFIHQNHRSKKLFLFGHSMGSIIARNVLLSYQKFQGVILCGTNYPPKLMLHFGKMLISLIKAFKGPKYKSPFINHMLFGNKLYTSLSSRTSFDWLSRKNPVVGAYIHDPYCGYLCTTSFYQGLVRLTHQAAKRKNIKKPISIPIHIISGEKDPVGSYGKDVYKLIHAYQKYEYSKLSYKFYPDCRHELLNELNHDEVYHDILHWLKKY